MCSITVMAMVPIIKHGCFVAFEESLETRKIYKCALACIIIVSSSLLRFTSECHHVKSRGDKKRAPMCLVLLLCTMCAVLRSLVRKECDQKNNPPCWEESFLEKTTIHFIDWERPVQYLGLAQKSRSKHYSSFDIVVNLVAATPSFTFAETSLTFCEGI